MRNKRATKQNRKEKKKRRVIYVHVFMFYVCTVDFTLHLCTTQSNSGTVQNHSMYVHVRNPTGKGRKCRMFSHNTYVMIEAAENENRNGNGNGKEECSQTAPNPSSSLLLLAFSVQ